MDIDNQIDIVSRLCDAVKEHICSEIKAGKVPQSWDGFELRWYLERAFESEARIGTRKGKRRKDFINHCNVSGLSY